VAAALDCIITVDESGAVVEFNPAAQRTFGWSREEALGRSLESLIVPDELRGALGERIAEFLATGGGPALNRRLELPARRKDGTPLTVELVGVAIQNEGRHEFTGFVRDITELRRTQEDLRRSQERYRAIVRHSSRLLVLCGAQSGTCTFLAGEAVLGYLPDTPLPEGFLGLVHPDDRGAAEAFLSEVRNGTRAHTDSVDLRLRTATGDYLVCETLGEDLTHVEAVQGVILRASDVTADRARRRELTDAMARMHTLIDSLGAAVLLEDEDRRLLVLNNASRELFGLEPPVEDLVGFDCSNAADTVKDMFTDPEAFPRGVDALVAGGAPILGEELALADGRTLERDYVPIRSGGRAAGHLWVYRDVSVRMEAQQKLAEQNSSLAQLAALKTEFVATVSHELRTPLTSVVSFTELLEDPELGPLNEDQATFLEVIGRNANKLLHLIEDLLLMAKLEAHTLSMTPGLIDSTRMVDDLVTEFAPQARAKNVALRLDAGDVPPLRGDVIRLQQVVSNLIGNAIAYTPEGGSIVLTSTADEGFWQLTVADTGVGIPFTDLAGIFDAFYRASNATSSTHSGTGLGLAISRLIVQQHGGSITAQSEPGVGTVMTVRLPIGGV